MLLLFDFYNVYAILPNIDYFIWVLFIRLFLKFHDNILNIFLSESPNDFNTCNIPSIVE